MIKRAALLSLFAAAIALPAAAGEYRGGRVPWTHQHPWYGQGPGLYYSQHPDHIPSYPQVVTGTAVPIYSTSRPVVHGDRYGIHEHWCAGRYRSYDAWTDTWQPHDGPRRLCRSPWR